MAANLSLDDANVVVVDQQLALLLQELQFRMEQARLELASFRQPHRDNQNAFFHCLMALFIFLMQCGFAFLEAGAVRAKNVTSILTKNVLDSLITIVSFWSIGWALAYGMNTGPLPGVFGFSQFFGIGLTNYSRFFFQYVFAARASTIISGAVAERSEFATFFAYSLFVPAIIYPMLAHWGWSEQGWLHHGIQLDNASNFRTTYLDYAGAGVVHLCGGTISLVAAWMIGPRQGRFGPRGQTMRIKGHSVPLASLGGFILMLGFLAFNGGSAVEISQPGNGQQVAKSMVNTLMCGAVAALCTLVVHKLRHDKWTVLLTINACLTGMIASCAGCNQMDGWGCWLTGLGAGLLYLALSELLLKWQIDDPVDAFAVHAGGGFWGLVSVCLVSTQHGRGLIIALFDAGGDDGSIVWHALAQLGWNLLAAVAIILWSALLILPLFGLLKLAKKFRVPGDIERKGIDIWKHGEEAYPLVAYGHGWNELEETALALEHFRMTAEMEKEFEENGGTTAPKAENGNGTTDGKGIATIWHDPNTYNNNNGNGNGIGTAATTTNGVNGEKSSRKRHPHPANGAGA